MSQNGSQISNSKLFKFFIIFFKLSGLIFFEYPLKDFKISKFLFCLFFVHFFFHIWFYYIRYIDFKDDMMKNSEIINGLVLFYVLYVPFVKFVSLFYTLISQKRIFNLFKNIESFNTKILKITSNIYDNHIPFLVLILFDAALTYYTLDSDIMYAFGDFIICPIIVLHFYCAKYNTTTGEFREFFVVSMITKHQNIFGLATKEFVL